MHKLLSADFSRLWKNKILWLGMIILFLWAVLLLTGQYRASLSDPEQKLALEELFFEYGPLIGGFCAVFTSLFIGTDYSDGAIRNKIIAGHSRASIYLSNIIVCSAAGILMNLAWIAAMLTAGTFMFGWFECSIAVIFKYLLITLLMVISFTSIYTLLCILNKNKAGAAVSALLVFLVLLFVGSYCDNRLHEPEIYSGGPVITLEEDGNIKNKMEEPQKNPDYPKGINRKILEFGTEFIPNGQGILLSHQEASHTSRLLLYSSIIILSTTGAGMFLFQRKDIK